MGVGDIQLRLVTGIALGFELIEDEDCRFVSIHLGFIRLAIFY